MVSDNGIARRCRIDLYTPAELVIRDAILAVENMPAHPLLTDAVVLLGQAKDKVADFVELDPKVSGKHAAYGQPTLPLRDHLIGLSNGGHCVRCGESSYRIQSHPDLACPLT